MSDFFEWKRVWEKSGKRLVKETVKAYPFTFPAELTCLSPAPPGELDHGDEGITIRYGPPGRRSGHRPHQFAFKEKRFRGRGPFPIVCRRVVFRDKAGVVLGGVSEPRAWSDADLTELAKQFLISAVCGDESAHDLLGKSCRSRYRKPRFRRELATWLASATPKDHPLSATVTPDQVSVNVLPPGFLDEYVQGYGLDVDGFPTEKIVAAVEVGAAFLTNSLYLFFTWEDGRLRIDVGNFTSSRE